jgi:SAGA-associated factor 73
MHFLVALFWLSLGVNSAPTSTIKSLPTSYTAIGDSYASGAGAGEGAWPPSQSFRCGRYSDAYPIQVANNSLINIDKSNFKHLACGGLTSVLILKDQVPYIAKDTDLVTLTASGNDVEFFKVVNECVYHWSPTIGCEAQLVRARNIIETTALQNLENIIAATTARLKPGARLIVTGYAKFFNEHTDECNNSTFSQTRPLDFLTKKKRRDLNQLVTMLNTVIKATALLHRATYVDIDHAFEGHRFCEPGVIEPDLEREDTWFFNIPPGDLGMLAHGAQQPFLGQTSMPDPEGAPEWPQMRTWRVFHPQPAGHTGISQVVVQEILRLWT